VSFLRFTVILGWSRKAKLTAKISIHLHQLRSLRARARAYSSQGEGRAQIVVEPKQELPFEIARGSRGGAAERGAGPTRAFIYRRRHETDSLSHFGRSVIEGRTDSEFSSPEVR
jgi:hypothetical protein